MGMTIGIKESSERELKEGMSSAVTWSSGDITIGGSWAGDCISTSSIVVTVT